MSSTKKKVMTMIQQRKRKIRQVELELKELNSHLAFLQGEQKDNIKNNT